MYWGDLVNGINRFRVYVSMVCGLYVCAHHPVSSGPRVRKEHLLSPQLRLLFPPYPSRRWAVCEGRGVCTEGPWGHGRVTPPQVQQWLPALLDAEPEGWGVPRVSPVGQAHGPRKPPIDYAAGHQGSRSVESTAGKGLGQQWTLPCRKDTGT